MSHQAVDAYIAAAPAGDRPRLAFLRLEILRNLPGVEEVFESGMPVYKAGEKWVAGFASRKKGCMLYVMDAALLDEFATQLGPRRSGKSCVELRPGKDHSAAQLEELARQILARLSQKREAAALTVR